jgi:16S rRNA (guanine527-N7)-methyltransferase
VEHDKIWAPASFWTGHRRLAILGPMTTDDALLEVLDQARRLGALGPAPVDDHVRHAQRFLRALADVDGPVLDLGSGGGVPGLVIAASRPDLHLTLLDAQARRIAFLDAAIASLGLGERVHAVHARAEDLAHDPAHRGRYGAVTARSFGPPAVVAECAVAFLRRSGLLLVSEPPDEPDRWPQEGLDHFGLRARGATDGIQVLEASDPCPATVPRRPGIPAKRPRF